MDGFKISEDKITTAIFDLLISINARQAAMIQIFAEKICITTEEAEQMVKTINYQTHQRTHLISEELYETYGDVDLSEILKPNNPK